MNPSHPMRLRMIVAAFAGTVLFAACGGGGSGSGRSSESEALPKVIVADAVALEPTANIETNLLPDLIVDHLNDDNKVNLRNYGVSDKPTLLWMWAPF